MFFNKLGVTATLSLMMICGLAQATPVNGKNFSATLEHKQGMLIFENDVFVGRQASDVAERQLMDRGVGLTSGFARWENGIIPYEFHPNLSDGGKTVARQAIEHWNEKSSITLIERDPNANSAVSDYVQFVTGPGCASWVGKQGQVQEIWVSSFCTAGSMIHEIGHAVGLLHEHTRADRDQYIEVRWENIQQDKAFNFELNASGSVDLGDYDYNSVMHYGDYFFSSNGEPTMRAINAGPDDVLGQRKSVSEGDLRAVNALYATDLALAIETTQIDNTTQASFTISNQRDMGAHYISLKFNTGGASNVVYDHGDNVICKDADAVAECTIAVLTGGDMVNVAVTIPALLSDADLNPVLRSKTHDANPLNNSLPESGNAQLAEVTSLDGAERDLAAAQSGGGGSGGGSVQWISALGLLLFALTRRRNNMLGSQG